MMSLFGPDLENPLDWKWISDRASRCEDQILSIACALSKTGTSSIVEIGLQRADKRSAVVSTIEKSGCSFQTHFLDIEATERWRRVEQRNTEKGETFSLIVTRDMFDFFEQMWEAPSKKELVSLHARELIATQV